MLTAVTIIIIIFLSMQVFPVAIGISVAGKFGKAILFVLILSAIQVVTYWLGLKLGNTFMHLMDGFKGAVFLIGFLLIGIRMLMETLSIRKGIRSYSINTPGQVLVTSIAQGMNTFLAGLFFCYLTVDKVFTLELMFILTLVIATVGIFLKPDKLTLSLASLLYALGGIIIIIISIYISFFVF